MTAMSAADAAWLFLERPNMPMHVGSLTLLAPPAGTDAPFAERLIEAWRAAADYRPPFNLRRRRGPLSLPLSAWETLPSDEIDFDYHVRRSALPRPGGERELGQLVSRLHSLPLDQSRPLWEIHVVEGLEGGRFALYAKLHHSLLDGMAGVAFLERMTVTDPGDTRMTPPWAFGMPERRHAEDRPREKAGALVLGALDLLRRLSGAGLTLAEAVVASRLVPAQSATPYGAPRSVLNTRIGAQRRFATQDYDMARLRRIAERLGVTINDVFLSICGGALRNYLAALGELPGPSLTAAVPVSLREAGDDAMGNAIGMVFVPLHSDIADPPSRLKAIHRSVGHAKKLMHKMPADARPAFAAMMAAPYLLQLGFGAGLVRYPACNLGISNVPGPAATLYYGGARIERIHPMSLIFDGQALNITALSYAGRFCLGFTGCRDSLPSMQRLAVMTGEALEALEAALGIAPSEEPGSYSPSPAHD